MSRFVSLQTVNPIRPRAHTQAWRDQEKASQSVTCVTSGALLSPEARLDYLFDAAPSRFACDAGALRRPCDRDSPNFRSHMEALHV
jgi:hypothetical protein